MPALDASLLPQLEQLQIQRLRREFVPTAREGYPQVVRGDRRLISFSCNDYLGLSQHVAVKQAAADAALAHGAGAGASRAICGHHILYDTLESQLAALKGTEAACVFGSGYLANLGTIPALVGKGDLILADKLIHACMVDAAQLSGATFKRFAHNDMTHLARLLEQYRTSHRHCLILTETVFSMDGDLAPLADLGALAERFDSWLMTDDAHGLGVIHQPNPAAIQMGTLSKAAGSYGGYVCGSRVLIDYLKTTARGLIYTTALPPAVLAASSAALELIAAHPEWGDHVVASASAFARELGIKPTGSAIVPVRVGEAADALALAAQLADAGFLVHPIRPPTVPAGTARLRVAFSRLHEEGDRATLATMLRHSLPFGLRK